MEKNSDEDRKLKLVDLRWGQRRPEGKVWKVYENENNNCNFW